MSAEIPMYVRMVYLGISTGERNISKENGRRGVKHQGEKKKKEASRQRKWVRFLRMACQRGS